MDNSIYSLVAQNCSSFYPRFTALVSCPDASVPDCNRCKYFQEMHCVKDLFDPIYKNIVD